MNNEIIITETSQIIGSKPQLQFKAKGTWTPIQMICIMSLMIQQMGNQINQMEQGQGMVAPEIMKKGQ